MDVSPTGQGPSFWRTCRVIANRRRLALFRLVARSGKLTVSEAAALLGYPLAQTSLYLRQLNARGLLQAQRRGKFTYYSVKPDNTIPYTADLVNALTRCLCNKKNAIDYVYNKATAFTHPRRQAIVKFLQHGYGRSGREIRKELQLSGNAFERHMSKLTRRGYIQHIRSIYRLVRPREPLAALLLKWAIKSP